MTIHWLMYQWMVPARALVISNDVGRLIKALYAYIHAYPGLPDFRKQCHPPNTQKQRHKHWLEVANWDQPHSLELR